MKATISHRKMNHILKQVNALKETMRAKTDEELAGMTEVLKARHAKGETLEHLLPEAFAAMREASFRVLGKFPYDVQVLGGIALHYEVIADMKTGEGKTLTAGMPIYLNALTGKSVILVTMNGYLAWRDAQEMGRVYRFMGLRIAPGIKENPAERLTQEEKKHAYSADVVYTTHSALVFDYLQDNLRVSDKDRCIPDFYYIIMDEADAVLLDAAQTPMVISGAPREQSMLLETADYFVTILEPGTDYEVDEEWQQSWLTEEGFRKAERYFRIENLCEAEHFELLRHIMLALKAHSAFEKEKHYLVTDGKVKLLDRQSGRVLENTKLRGGIQQAIEVKEQVETSNETRSMASITYKEFFALFPKTSGMSGSVLTDVKELRKLYGKKVLSIPTNHPCIRKDRKDECYATEEQKLQRTIDLTLQRYAEKRPVLLVTESIRVSELLSRRLLEQGVPHNVLNAYNEAKEAQIIAEAGVSGAVTIATSMAGRGTDIHLEEDTLASGGLTVILVGRMGNKRLEQQARGRAGRQGNPGEAYTITSLGDEVVTEYGAERLDKIKHKNRLSYGRLHREINEAQVRAEEVARSGRKMSIEFDESLQTQRRLIYRLREQILGQGGTSLELVKKWTEESIAAFVKTEQAKSVYGIHCYVMENLTHDHRRAGLDLPKKLAPKAVQKALLQLMEQCLEDKAEELKAGRMEAYLRICLLNAIDEQWIEEVDYLQQLRNAVNSRGVAQRNLLHEYADEAKEAYLEMAKRVKRDALRNYYLGEPVMTAAGKLKVLLP